jgi:hypothetical protein
MVEDLIKDTTKFGIEVIKKAIIAIAIIVTILIVLFVLETGADVAIGLAKQGVNFIDYVANALL